MMPNDLLALEAVLFYSLYVLIICTFACFSANFRIVRHYKVTTNVVLKKNTKCVLCVLLCIAFSSRHRDACRIFFFHITNNVHNLS